MSAPSFSSFPPTFSSFPDLDTSQAGPSKENKSRTPEGDKHERRKGEKRKHKEDKGRKDKDRAERDGSERRSKHKKRERNSERQQTDEQLKEREDSHRRTPEQSSFTDPSSLTVFSDRKGDVLNVKYGRLHAGDIPRYNLVGREYSICVCSDNLVTEAQVEDEYWGLGMLSSYSIAAVRV